MSLVIYDKVNLMKVQSQPIRSQGNCSSDTLKISKVGLARTNGWNAALSLSLL